MNKIKFKVTILLLILTSFVLVSNAQNKKERINVLEFYKIAEKDVLENDKLTTIVVKKDLKNGYIKLKGSDNFTQIEAALFRKEDDSPLLVVFKEYATPEIYGADISLSAYELVTREGKTILDNVSMKVFPTLSMREEIELFNKNRTKSGQAAKYISTKYEMPQKGQIIRVTAGNYGEDDFEKGVLLYELHFSKDKFVIVRK